MFKRFAVVLIIVSFFLSGCGLYFGTTPQQSQERSAPSQSTTQDNSSHVVPSISNTQRINQPVNRVPIPLPPTGLHAVSITKNYITIMWNAVDNATDYTVNYCILNKSTRSWGPWLRVSASQETSYSLGGLAPGETLNIYVTSTNSSGTSNPSQEIQVKTKSNWF